MPPPTESQILTSFLIPPSPLPVVLPPTAFAALFPPSTPQASIAHLYRLLSHHRALLTDAVKSDIEDEAKRGVAQRRAVVKTRREQERGEDDEEVRIERALSTTNPAPLAHPRHHTLRTILPTLDTATEDIETEVALLELEAETLLAGIRNTVGGLSDLRYGRFRNQEVGEGVRGGLEGGWRG
ncbi:hypothetical protein VC83_08889 [Pseudogymnoascus destructans]|uniref:Uncharacterized protein n=1 Tax=Pseudogymnoascus destructans TaxID=655981 RepID=A0A176ZY06_9PEZI|nr:uncharacterized protein VC83_08889 [Pseudogymnoascus destructans]OAF54786.1 hypothetical protein VC83_08889 [Pseudogymnoascus destructans]